MSVPKPDVIDERTLEPGTPRLLNRKWTVSVEKSPSPGQAAQKIDVLPLPAPPATT